MHTKGLVHGDIKPQNVVITAMNDAKLIDFAGNGFSRGYYAPELYDVIDSRVLWENTLDIYSFGVLLQGMLVGEPHFIDELTYQQLYAFVSACCSENPSDRPHISEAITVIKQAGEVS